MVTRTDLVAKKERFSPKNGDENEARRQKEAFLNQKWRRKRGSSPKKSVSHRKMVTRTRLVAKNGHISPQNGDENRSRRQKRAFLTEKWRRKRGSSSKTSFSHSKMVTRTDLVAKNGHILPKNGDENQSRRQKQAFLNQKWRRKRGSSPKTSVSHSKMVTRMGLVVKNKLFSTKSGDENRARRQKQAFLTQKW
ncbi:hypothetical protein QPM05_10800 [Caldibacillus thermoamylovorans]|nr:hypothetical protein [Caldibacillus thermoamylovorans]